MRTYKSDVEADVKVGETTVSIRRKGTSEVMQANIVAREALDDSPESRLWLDRLLHAEHESVIGGYPVRGAFVTEILIPNGVN